MKVSIIIPVYNGENFVDKVADSVFKQTYTNWELILVNDKSTDQSLKKLRELAKTDKRIKVVNNKVNCGPGGAKNEGLKKAKGDYVFFIDCDDYIAADFIEKLVLKAKEDGYPDLILSNFTKVDENGAVLYIRDYKNKERAYYQKITTWGKLFKLSFIKKYDLNLPYGQVLEDILFHASVVLANPSYAFLDNAGYYYVCNSTSITHTTFKSFKKDSLKEATAYLISLKKHPLLKNYEKLDYYAYKYVCWHLLKSGNKVGSQAMKQERQFGFNFLEKEFPNYKKFKNINIKEERFIIKFVLFNILLLHKLHLDNLFFMIYSNINLERFWPDL